MEKENTKKVLIGDTGNKAEVSEEERDASSLDAQHAKALITQAGKLFAPIGSIYLGSATCHYYESSPGTFQRQFFVACQTDVSLVEEGHADLGWKQLKSALMSAYGRKEPKNRE